MLATHASAVKKEAPAVLADGWPLVERDDQSVSADSAAAIKSEEQLVDSSKESTPTKRKRPSTAYKVGARVGKNTYQARRKSLEKRYQERLRAALDERSSSSSVSALEQDLIRLDDRLQEERKRRANLEKHLAAIIESHERTTRDLINENTFLKAKLEEMSRA